MPETVEILVSTLADFDRLPSPQISEAERSRAQRFVSTRRRNQYLLGRHLMRCLVRGGHGSDERLTPVEVWPPRGRPTVLGDPRTYNVSHDGDTVVCVRADAPVGVDVMEHGPSDWGRLEADIHSPDDRELLSDDPAERVEQSRASWIVKESWLKCIGVGLRHPMPAVDILWRQRLALIDDATHGSGAGVLIEFPDFTVGVAQRGAHVAPISAWMLVVPDQGRQQVHELRVLPRKEVATTEGRVTHVAERGVLPASETLAAGCGVAVTRRDHQIGSEGSMWVHPLQLGQHPEVGPQGAHDQREHLGVRQDLVGGTCLPAQELQQAAVRPLVADLCGAPGAVATGDDDCADVHPAGLQSPSRGDGEAGAHAVSPQGHRAGSNLCGDRLRQARHRPIGTLEGLTKTWRTTWQANHRRTEQVTAHQLNVGGGVAARVRKADQP